MYLHVCGPRSTLVTLQMNVIQIIQAPNECDSNLLFIVAKHVSSVDGSMDHAFMTSCLFVEVGALVAKKKKVNLSTRLNHRQS